MSDTRPLLPPPVSPGGLIGLFSPAGPVRDKARYEQGLTRLQELGYRIRITPREDTHEYLAADDASRATEFLELWSDPEVEALLAVRGGYGCLRMLPFLDLEQLASSPKRLVGFSDLTVLLNAVSDRTGIITLHGPVLTSLADADDTSMSSLFAMLSGGLESVESGTTTVLREGIADGILRGGNLTTLSHLLGTPWEIPLHGTILLLEDTGEPMYRIDRMLTQLYVSGRLEQAAGIILGSFDCGDDEAANRTLRERAWNRVLELTVHSGCPVWGDFPVGHGSVNHTLPIGAPVQMENGRLVLQHEKINTI
ncbi:MAG: LD-carboxypeptidase [Desulfobulbaceae bacterium]